MKDSLKTKQELIKELSVLKKKISKLGKSESQQKLIEMELHKSEHKFRQLAEDMPALICTFLPDSTLTYVNKAYCELFQKRPDDLVGKKFLDFLPDNATRENVVRQYMSLTAENPVKTYEHKVILSDGTDQYHWHRWTDRAFFNDNGQISHFQSIGQEITERKRVDEAVRENEDRLMRISSIISDVTYSCTSDENGTFSINWMMGAAELVTGYSIDEIKEQGCWGFLVIEEDKSLFEENVIGLAPGSTGSCELRIRHKNGGIVWLASCAECVMVSEKFSRSVLYGGIIDITERKRAEAESNLYAKELEDANT
ncbi:MAG: PAS domain-containing protein, partial [Deltaproteobacteria bacterium]